MEVGNFRGVIEALRGKRPDAIPEQRDKSPGKPRHHAGIDDPPPWLGQMTYGQNEDNDPGRQGNGYDPPSARGMKITHAEKRSEKKVEAPGVFPEVAGSGGYTRGELPLESMISFRVGHEQHTGKPCQPMVPAERNGESGKSQGGQTIDGTADEQENPRDPPDCANCSRHATVSLLPVTISVRFLSDILLRLAPVYNIVGLSGKSFRCDILASCGASLSGSLRTERRWVK
jgi:hypothetical protein